LASQLFEKQKQTRAKDKSSLRYLPKPFYPLPSSVSYCFIQSMFNLRSPSQLFTLAGRPHAEREYEPYLKDSYQLAS
jgi:hypothetical protein